MQPQPDYFSPKYSHLAMRTRPIPAADPSLSRMLKWASHPDAALPPATTQLPDGPRSLPTRRVRQPEIRELSYSSIALAASDDPRVAATLSLPDRPPLSHDPRRVPPPIAPRHQSLHGHEHVRRLRSQRPEDEPQPSLTRSDSLLNRARRVFSLPASLKRRTPRTFVPSVDTASAADRERLAAFSYRRRNKNLDHHSSFSTKSRRRNSSFIDTAAVDLEDTDPKDMKEAEARIRVLESQLEAERIRSSRLKKKIDKLEEEGAINRQALPAVETIIKSALSQFEAKEVALKHTISKIDQEYSAVLAEKNEAMRLLNAFVGRSGRSPPASFSSVSESGTEVYNRDSRRVLSMDTFRRSRPVGLAPESTGSSIGSNSGSLPSKRP